MAKVLRIDGSPIRRANGNIEFKYTYGDAPLPQAPDGSGILFTDQQGLGQFTTDFENAISPQVLLQVALTRWRAQNSAMTNDALIRNKEVTFDPNAVQVIQIN